MNIPKQPGLTAISALLFTAALFLSAGKFWPVLGVIGLGLGTLIFLALAFIAIVFVGLLIGLWRSRMARGERGIGDL